MGHLLLMGMRMAVGTLALLRMGTVAGRWPMEMRKRPLPTETQTETPTSKGRRYTRHTDVLKSDLPNDLPRPAAARGVCVSWCCPRSSLHQPWGLHSPCGPGFARRLQSISARAVAVVLSRSTLSYFQPGCNRSPCGPGFARRFQSISSRAFAVPAILARSTLSYLQPRRLRSPCGPGFARQFQNISARMFAVVSACSILSYWHRLLMRLRLRQCRRATAGHCGAPPPPPSPPPPPLLCAAPHSACQAQSGARSECGET
jgi:hypothetical protein